MFFLYILYSENIGKYYVGHSNDYLERVERHNRGGAKYTSAGQPWRLVHKEAYDTKIEAAKREREIKNWKSKKLIEELIRAAG